MFQKTKLNGEDPTTELAYLNISDFGISFDKILWITQLRNISQKLKYEQKNGMGTISRNGVSFNNKLE